MNNKGRKNDSLFTKDEIYHFLFDKDLMFMEILKEMKESEPNEKSLLIKVFMNNASKFFALLDHQELERADFLYDDLIQHEEDHDAKYLLRLAQEVTDLEMERRDHL